MNLMPTSAFNNQGRRTTDDEEREMTSLKGKSMERSFKKREMKKLNISKRHYRVIIGNNLLPFHFKSMTLMATRRVDFFPC
jgi:hypothetical protein